METDDLRIRIQGGDLQSALTAAIAEFFHQVGPLQVFRRHSVHGWCFNLRTASCSGLSHAVLACSRFSTRRLPVTWNFSGSPHSDAARLTPMKKVTISALVVCFGFFGLNTAIAQSGAGGGNSGFSGSGLSGAGSSGISGSGFSGLSAAGLSSLNASQLSGLSGLGISGLTGGTTSGSSSSRTGTTGSTGSTGSFGSTGSTGTTGNTGSTSGRGNSATAGGTGTGAGTGNGFVGGNQSQTFVGAGQQQGNRANTNRQFQFQAAANNSMQSTQSTGTVRQVKTALRVGFSLPATSQAGSGGILVKANAASLDRYVTRYPQLSGIAVSLQPDGVAVLSGETASPETVKLAENLVRLQPGVRRVENQTSIK